MLARWAARDRALVTVAVGAIALGLTFCSDDDNQSSPADCPRQLDGECVGVATPIVCGEDFCTGDASCTRIWHVKQGSSGDGTAASPFGSLGEAAAKATTDECIALAPGSYQGGVVLAGGTRLLGAGSDEVTIDGPGDAPALAIAGGEGGEIRGLSIEAASVGLALQDTARLRVAELRISSAVGVGIDARGCGELALQHVQVDRVLAAQAPAAGVDGGSADADAADAGVDGRSTDDAGVDGPPTDAGADATDPTDATPGADASIEDAGADDTDAGVDPVDPDAPADAHGIGLVLAEGTSATVSGCLVQDTATQGMLIHGSQVKVERTQVVGAGRFGVAIDCAAGCPGSCEVASSSIEDSGGIGLLIIEGQTAVRQTNIGPTSYAAGFARGVQVQGAAEVVLEANRIHHSVGQGVVIDGARGKLLANEISDNEERGVVLQSVVKDLLLDGNQVVANERAGIACIGSTAVTVKAGRVAETKKRIVMADDRSGMVGDGIQVVEESSVTIAGVSITDNGRLGVLIDSSKSNLADAKISGGEEGLVVQNASVGDQSFSNITDDADKNVSPLTPDVPYLFNPVQLAGTLPIPLP